MVSFLYICISLFHSQVIYVTSYEIIGNATSTIKHEAKITNLDREKMFYLNNKKIDHNEAKNLLSFGFIQSFSKELPMEYAIEIKRLMNEY